jgi:hypothetical protein
MSPDKPTSLQLVTRGSSKPSCGRGRRSHQGNQDKPGGVDPRPADRAGLLATCRRWTLKRISAGLRNSLARWRGRRFFRFSLDQAARQALDPRLLRHGVLRPRQASRCYEAM